MSWIWSILTISYKGYGNYLYNSGPSETVLAYAILQFSINVYNVYFNIPVSKAIHQNSIKVKQRQQCRSASENLIKFMVPDFFVYVFLNMAWMGMMNSPRKSYLHEAISMKPMSANFFLLLIVLNKNNSSFFFVEIAFVEIASWR